MAFIFWAGLAFLLGCAFCVHFDVFGFRKRLTRSFFYVFDFVLPNTDSRGRRMKIGMAKTASYIFAVILFLLLASIFLSFGVPYGTGGEENKYTGPLGDLFNGILTPVLTFLTFCGLLVTILIQNIQMKATLNELEFARKEYEKTSNALAEQVKTSRIQAKNSIAQKFDSNFYEMLKLHTDISEKLKNKQKIILEEVDKVNSESGAWAEFKRPDDYRSFFLINYQILKFIKKNEDIEIISSDEAKQYSNIVRAMLNDDLYGLIFLNCLNERFSKYKELIENYSFLEHFVFSGFKDAYVLKAISKYSRKAFGDLENMKSFLINKKNSMVMFVGAGILSYMDLTENIINGDVEFLDPHGMSSFMKYYPSEYDNAVKKLDDFNVFRSKIIDVNNNLSLIEILDDAEMLDAFSSKQEFFFLRKYKFDFNNYLDLIRDIFDLTKNWNDTFIYMPSHIKIMEHEISVN